MKVAGICGETAQAVREAATAREAGYDLGLLSLAALPAATDDELLAHCRAVAETIPVCGFYLQPSVGGRLLSYEFWREFCEIPAVVAIKVAPFNRYQTLDVVRAVADSGRAEEIALYTGNDDNIIADLVTEFRVSGRRLVLSRRVAGAVGGVDAPRGGVAGGRPRVPRRRGPGHRRDSGRLGGADRRQRRAVRRAQPLRRLHRRPARDSAAPGIAGGTLVPRSRRRTCRPDSWRRSTASATSYPELTDDEFVRENLDRWLR